MKNNKALGFTFIELIVVISIISILLFFSFPLFENISFLSSPKGYTGHIVRLINDLKKLPAKENMDFFMHIDINTDMIWITNENMDEIEKQKARQKAFLVSDDIEILDVQLHQDKEKRSEFKIRFRKQDYSDSALIHLIDENEKHITLKIEPFLSRVEVLNEHIFFEDCT